MKWINNVLLLFRSLLSKHEKRLLVRVIKLYKSDNGYKISNYNECKTLVKIGYKLNDRMDYLCKKNKLHSDEYESIKNKNQCINIIIKEYSLST